MKARSRSSRQRTLDAKLAIKIHRSKIVIFDELKLEQAEAAFSLLYGNTAVAVGGASYRMAGGSFSTKITDTAKKAKVCGDRPGNRRHENRGSRRR